MNPSWSLKNKIKKAEISFYTLHFKAILSVYGQGYQKILESSGYARTQDVLVYFGRCDHRCDFFCHFYGF
jgi:hypothetical protein